MNLSGNFSANQRDRVDSVKSAQSTTTLSAFSPASTKPFPYPSRVGVISSLDLSKIFSTNFAFGFIIIISIIPPHQERDEETTYIFRNPHTYNHPRGCTFLNPFCHSSFPSFPRRSS